MGPVCPGAGRIGVSRGRDTGVPGPGRGRRRRAAAAARPDRDGYGTCCLGRDSDRPPRATVSSAGSRTGSARNTQLR